MDTTTLAEARELATKHSATITPQTRSVYYDLEFADPAMNQFILRGTNLGLIVERLQHIETTVKPQQAYRHSWDGNHFFYYHKVCVDHNPPEVHFGLIPLSEVPQEAECDFCYKPVHGPSAYYPAQDQEVQA